MRSGVRDVADKTPGGGPGGGVPELSNIYSRGRNRERNLEIQIVGRRAARRWLIGAVSKVDSKQPARRGIGRNDVGFVRP